ncbi:MAG: DUF2442 domain-containing protein [Prevotellaceae bacterium]|jgi:hypothetical protein|nr:DUF2442 domain-containing protein [Prevotellaceae bacterium]
MITVNKVWTTADAIFIQTADGKVGQEKFDEFPRLRWATPKQRNNYEVGVFGIHWEELDEDLSFEGFFDERKEETSLYKLFFNHPELNASEVARRMGIKQSLLAQYISGTKNPSEECFKEILNTIRQIGAELCAV